MISPSDKIVSLERYNDITGGERMSQGDEVIPPVILPGTDYGDLMVTPSSRNVIIGWLNNVTEWKMITASNKFISMRSKMLSTGDQIIWIVKNETVGIVEWYHVMTEWIK